MLIVFEGIDGTGKSTQIELTKASLEAKGKTVKCWKFPCYGEPTGALVTRYLNNEFGPATEVDPVLASSLYMLDRALAKPALEADIEKYDYVLLDRYFYSNIALQGAKHGDRKDEIKDIMMSIEATNLPKPDVVFLLTTNEKALTESLDNRDEDKDGHEGDIEYLLSAQQIYRDLLLDLMDDGIACNLYSTVYTVDDALRVPRDTLNRAITDKLLSGASAGNKLVIFPPAS